MTCYFLNGPPGALQTQSAMQMGEESEWIKEKTHSNNGRRGGRTSSQLVYLNFVAPLRRIKSSESANGPRSDDHCLLSNHCLAVDLVREDEWQE